MNAFLEFAVMNVKRQFPVVLVIFFLMGCQTAPVSYSGGTVPPSKQVQLVEGGERSGRYSTEDLQIDYEYSRSGNNLNVSGSLYFADRIIYSFRRVEAFHADLFFVDAKGRVLETQGLTTSSFVNSDSAVNFGRRVVIPPNAAALSFGYSGTAKSDDDGGRLGRGGGDMYFSDYPAR